VLGSRFAIADAATLESTTRLRRLGMILIILALRLFGNIAKVSDPTSGFRVYSSRAVTTLIRTMPDEYPEPETVAILASNDLQIVEHHVDMLPRQAGVSSLSRFKSMHYMIKVLSALLGLRIRILKTNWRFSR
jgi:hypothetical protein